ncbi:hypothetical protein N8T08_006851 [Aspergillus melleus]|uniref:Uncharacterized protein n=1 Tax=Aspergillus melleus TaxID=138277 RepID=A0ACC3AZA3_9EURO|nr:hypothetical protein N8T08_006851 [Aspergillus melleus]
MPYPVKETSRLAAILDENQVRHVLGFDMNIILWGSPLCLDDVQFIVHDEHFLNAVDLITNAGYTLCTDKECRVVQPSNPVQIPETHFHCSQWPESIALGFYKKSNIYWALPDFPIEHPGPSDPNFMLSNNPRLPAHHPWDPPCWAADLYPAKILTPVALTETLILLASRDVYHPNELMRGWLRFQIYAVMHAKEKWVKPEDLQPHFRTYYRLLYSEPVSGRNLGLDVQEELAKLRRMMLDSMPPPQNTRKWSSPEQIETYE